LHAYLLAAYAQKADTTKTAAEKAALLKLRPGFSTAGFKAQRFSDDPYFWSKPNGTCLRVYAVPGFPRHNAGNVPSARWLRNVRFSRARQATMGRLRPLSM
jgi:hypothetical protein